MARVHTPVAGFSGTVAGVAFASGVAETDDSHVLGYFARHGYRIDTGEPDAPVESDGDLPAGNASAAEWRAYAVAKGLDAARVDSMTRDQIRELF